MRIDRIAFGCAATALLGAGAVQGQQSITFSGPTPPVTVMLTPGSNIDIQTNGNVNAACVPGTGPNADRCVGMPLGGGGGQPPTVSIAAGGFSQPADGNGRYPPGTSFTITPTVSSNPASVVCLRRTLSGTSATATWPGLVQAPYSAVLVTMPGSSAINTYGFDMQCFGVDGSAVSNQLSYSTFGADLPPPVDCSSVTPPVGYTRSQYDQFTDLPSVNFFGQFIHDFPSTGSDQGRLVHPVTQFTSIQFTAPPQGSPLYPNPNGGTFTFTESQVGGDANLNSTYVTISRCVGDFRIPASNATAPAGDPTFANGCRNIDFASAPPTNPSLILRRIDYSTQITQSTFSSCAIVPGQVYYLNMILADPRGGITAGENTCSNMVSGGCGIQMNIE